MPVSEISWPAHWYDKNGRIRCIVPNCPFFSVADKVFPQWYEIHKHSKETQGVEHDLLEIMLRQTHCFVIGSDCGHRATGNESYKIRQLFDHEKIAHNGTAMSNISSFVRLAREGRVRAGGFGRGPGLEPEPNCERLAFLRMMEKVHSLPAAALDLLFRKGGFHDPHQQTPANMGKILTNDPLAQPGDDPPFWWPVRADHFLSFCRPHPTDPADAGWRNLWNSLRAMYADGRI